MFVWWEGNQLTLTLFGSGLSAIVRVGLVGGEDRCGFGGTGKDAPWETLANPGWSGAATGACPSLQAADRFKRVSSRKSGMADTS
jgi:hypothetical protein